MIDEYHTEIVNIALMQDEIGQEYCELTIRITKEEGQKLKLGNCKIINNEVLEWTTIIKKEKGKKLILKNTEG